MHYSFLGRLLRRTRIFNHLKQSDVASSSRIIALRSLQRLENGETIKNKHKYIELAEFYGSCFSNDIELLSTLLEFESDIMFLFYHDGRIKQFENLEIRLNTFINSYGNYLYYSELARLYLSVVQSQLYGTFQDLSLIYLLEEEYTYLHGNTLSLALLLLYRASLHSCSKMPSEYYDKKITSIIGTPLLSFEEVYYDTARYKVYEFLLEYKSKKDNKEGMESYYYRYHVLDGLALGEFESKNRPTAYSYLTQLVNDPETESTLPKHYYLQLQKRAGILSYSMEMYQRCYDHMIFVHRNNPSILEYNYLFLFDSMKKLNRIEEKKELIQSLNKSDSYFEQVRFIIELYQEKYSDNPDFEHIENLLCDHLSERMIAGSLYKPILREQMISIVDITHHYEKLADFIRQ